MRKVQGCLELEHLKIASRARAEGLIDPSVGAMNIFKCQVLAPGIKEAVNQLN